MNLTHLIKLALEEVKWEVTSQVPFFLNTANCLSRKTNNVIKATPPSELNRGAWDQAAPSVPCQLCFEGEQDQGLGCGLSLLL